jgi:macrolide-specific efflux system membrane fusion protein
MKTFLNKFHKAFLLLIPIALNCKRSADVHPQYRNVIDAVFASGHIENLYQYSVNANADGYLDKIAVIEGDTVKTGQLLFKLSNDIEKAQVYNAKTSLDYSLYNAREGSPQINQLKFQIAQAKQKKSVDSLNYVRYSRLVKTLAVSKADEDNARIQYLASSSNLDVLNSNLKDLYHNLKNNVDNAKAQLDIQKGNDDFYILKATDPGIVLSVSKKLGDLAKKGDVIAQIGSGTSIAKLYIAEDDIHRVKLGQTVLISLNSDKYHPVNAVIKKIYPQFDNNDQSFVVDAYFTDKALQPINGTQLQANIIISEKSNALVIPSYYILNGNYVFVKGKSDKVPVKTGISTLEYTEILSGLSVNDVLLTPKQLK